MIDNILATPFYSDRAFNIIRAAYLFYQSYKGGSSFGCVNGSAIKRNINGSIEINRGDVSWRHQRMARKMDLSNIGFACKDMIRDFDASIKDKTSETVINPSQCRALKWKCQYNDTDSDVVFLKSMNIVAKELWCIFDICLGHSLNTVIKRYGKDFVNDLVGSPKDPFIIEFEKAHAEELNNIYQKYQSDITDVKMKYDMQIKTLANERDSKVMDRKEEYKKSVNQCNIEFEEQLKQIKENLSAAV